MQIISHKLSRFDVTFDDEKAVANAGLMLPAMLAESLQIESVINETVKMGGPCWWR